MKSSWQETRAKSTYHFDPTKKDNSEDVLINLGYYAPGPEWDQSVQEVIDHCRPATWATRGYKGQGRDIPSADLEAEEYDLTSHGMSADLAIGHIGWHVPPIFQQVADTFQLTDVMIRMHVQHPGEVWNRHIDKLQKWYPENPDRVQRIFVQLTDWQPGQFWEFGNYHWNHWQRGDIVTFDWQNMPHCTANAGHHARVTMQVTGVKFQA